MPHRRWTVGALSDMLGIAAPTLRTWERRYGIGPTYRTGGGHRRYTIVDADRVATMAHYIDAGLAPREAADRVRRMTAQQVAHAVGAGPEGLRVSAVGHARETILAAARDFDGAAIEDEIEEAIDHLGVEDAWDAVIAPVLDEVVGHWDDDRLGVAVEHLVTAKALTALRTVTHDSEVRPGPHIVLASLGEEMHKLPLVAVGAALAHHGLASTELGARLPTDALEAFVQATDPAAVVVWASQRHPAPEDIERLRRLGHDRLLILGGPAWPEGTESIATVADAVMRLRQELDEDLR